MQQTTKKGANMETAVIDAEPTQPLTAQETVRRIRALIESGEIANVPYWGDGKFIVGDGKGKWHYEAFVLMFKALHEAMRAVDPSIPPGLPPHCLDPKSIAKIFRIPLADMNAPTTARPTKPEPPPRPSIPSPYLDAQQAADYLGMTVKALYGHVERRKLRPLPGYKKYRFRKEQLDAFLRGEKP
jgi:hypothetical protein